MRSSALLLFLAARALFGEAPFVIIITDAPGVGFNDPTPTQPIGGNDGATIGEQRLIALKHAASLWAAKIESNVPTRIDASFDSLPCSAESGRLGETSAGNAVAWPDAPEGAEVLRNVWYPTALANKFADSVVDPDHVEIYLTLNSDVGTQGCLENSRWYYGLDNRALPADSDMVTLLLHELAHGLGITLVDQPGFAQLRGKGSVYTQYIFDNTTGKNWNEMDDEERAASARNSRRVAWAGVNAWKDALEILEGGLPSLRVTNPPTLAGSYEVGFASFGPSIGSRPTAAQLVLAVDDENAAGPLSTDACTPLINASAVAGRIAVADRGTCTFVQKARMVQAAGAIAMIVADSADGSPPPEIAGTAPDVEIVVARITRSDGALLKQALSNFQIINANLSIDPAMRRGADRAGRPLLHASDPAVRGTALGHWDFSIRPRQLMEANLVHDLKNELGPPGDLTLGVLTDLGWRSDFDGVPDGVDECPQSDPRETVFLGDCESGAPNTNFTDGCKISDRFEPCNQATGASLAFCVDSISRTLVASGYLDVTDARKIRACAAQSSSGAHSKPKRRARKQHLGLGETLYPMH